jgi:ArsR family metal-binding transcriptional regulator
MSKVKYILAKCIGDNYVRQENPTYEQLLEAIHDNYFRTISKCPVNVFVLGCVNIFVIKDVDHANRILNVLKEVVKEALEIGGFELTYTDRDWLDLTLVKNVNPSFMAKENYALSKYEKKYMGEYFEF